MELFQKCFYLHGSTENCNRAIFYSSSSVDGAKDGAWEMRIKYIHIPTRTANNKVQVESFMWSDEEV